MFTGFFKLNIGNPVASAKFGIPYSARPVSFKISYKYSLQKGKKFKFLMEQVSKNLDYELQSKSY